MHGTPATARTQHTLGTAPLRQNRRVTTPTTFALIRHGQTDWNAQIRIQGSTDIPLNAIGRGQATDAESALSPHAWDFVVSSPLSRAAETADIIAFDLDLAVTERLPQLVERDYGPAEGLTAGPELDALRILDGGFGGFRGAESEEAVTARGLAALRDLARTWPGARIVVVAHGTLIRLCLSEALGRAIPSIDNAALTLVHLTPATPSAADAWTLEILNGELVPA